MVRKSEPLLAATGTVVVSPMFGLVVALRLMVVLIWGDTGVVITNVMPVKLL
jgi:hypothetical protein